MPDMELLKVLVKLIDQLNLEQFSVSRIVGKRMTRIYYDAIEGLLKFLLKLLN